MKAVLGAFVGLACACSKPEPLPVLGEMAFELVDQTGEETRAADFAGKVAIVSFVFTSCPTICPGLTRAMRTLTDDLEGHSNVVFLSFTVDPENDTPEVLRAYMARNQATSSRWRFLTGSPQRVRDAVSRFKVAMGERQARNDGSYDIVHDGHFVLVDGHGKIRNYYRTDEDGLAALRRDALLLAGVP